MSGTLWKDARDTARHRRDELDREEARIHEVEQKKKRMKAEVARLLQKVNGLERRAEAEATQVRHARSSPTANRLSRAHQ